MASKTHVTRLGHVSLTRTAADSVEIAWKIRDKNAGTVIFLGESPDKIDHRKPALKVKGKSNAWISDLDPDARYYFELVSDHGPKMIISERRVPLQGAVNFRDLGGYETADGRRVKWGRVFRSDNLGRLADRDVAYLRRMGIAMVCDFRTPAEVEKLPDRFPAGGRGKYVHLPVKHGESDPADTFERIRNRDCDWMTEEYMVRGYIRNIERFAAIWSEFFSCLADRSNRPLVFHCTGGKDRAGVGAALILMLLGVPEETIIQDHGLSNIYIAGVLAKIYVQIRSMGVDPKEVAPYFTAPRSAIVAMINHVKESYGSAAGYLAAKAGVDPQILNQLKADLLE